VKRETVKRESERARPQTVMTGLVPVIHAAPPRLVKVRRDGSAAVPTFGCGISRDHGVDGRDKPGHDGDGR